MDAELVDAEDVVAADKVDVLSLREVNNQPEPGDKSVTGHL